MPVFWQFSGQNNIARLIKNQSYDVPGNKEIGKCYLLWLEELSENLSFTSEKNDVSLNIKVKNCTTWKL